MAEQERSNRDPDFVRLEVARDPESGRLFGYFWIPPEGKYYRVRHWDIPVSLHCNLTYSSELMI